MKLPSYSLRSLLFLVVAIALFLPHYPFLEYWNFDLTENIWHKFFPVQKAGEHTGKMPPLFVPFPPGVSVKRGAWLTAAAEVFAIVGWLLLKRLRARRMKNAEATT